MNKSFSETYLDFQQVDINKLFLAATETLYMTVISMVFVIAVGLSLGLALYYLGKKKKSEAGILYTIISIISNVFRSTPFIILIVLLLPFTKLIVGSMIGAKAAIPALVLSAAPFYARLVEMAFREVDQGVLEASAAMGANRFQIIWKVLIPESSPALISGLTVTIITMIGFTAMAGAIGAGGLGQLAWQEGFQGGNLTVTLVATIALLLIVFILQWIGDTTVKIVDKRSI